MPPPPSSNTILHQPDNTTSLATQKPAEHIQQQTPMLRQHLRHVGRPIGVRSSLFSHTFPPFYACYLLKSIQTPESTTVYIGSTPSPPRRIRQHNGELTQGARKTQRKRPWIMQMIVHGFPSRLAALKFEWAWQHPHRSRHLRDADGSLFGARASRMLKKNIAIVQAMISMNPFRTWPLHVKLFTEEAVQYWNAAAAAAKTAYPLPPGFVCSVELEGVDGKSGLTGSGRQGPIEVDDEKFTSELLAKNTALVASGRDLDCSICHEPLENYASDPLNTALCPTEGCVATSHIACLSHHFLNEEKEERGMIPRGGKCKSCGSYTLWGDIVRGCYRRVPPVANDGPEHPDVATDDMFLSDEEDEEAPKKRKSSSKKSRAGSPTGARRGRPPKGKGKEKAADSSLSSTGESFDFGSIASSSEGDMVTPKRRPGRPRKNIELLPSLRILSPKATPTPATSSKKKTASPSPSKKSRSPTKAKRKTKVAQALETSSEGEVFDFRNIVSSSDSEDGIIAKRSPGRPRKNKGSSPPGILSPANPTPRNRKSKSPTSKPRDKITEKAKGKRKATKKASSSSEGEVFDFTNIASSSGSSDVVPVKRKPGRPRKNTVATPIISPYVRPSLNGQDIPPLKSPYHNAASTRDNIKPRSADSGSGESFDFKGICNSGSSEENHENFHRYSHYGDNEDCDNSGIIHYYPPQTPMPARTTRVLASPSLPHDHIWRDDDLERAMSGLAVSTPSQPSLLVKDRQTKEIEVIELSD